jgi:hypothetical protein
MNGTNANIKVDTNGAMTISNAESVITIMPDGTIAISSYAPVQLTGDTLGKFDSPQARYMLADVQDVLSKRGNEKR